MSIQLQELTSPINVKKLSFIDPARMEALRARLPGDQEAWNEVTRVACQVILHCASIVN